MKNKLAGFSLMELLVVISIIGILVTIVYANFSDSRISAKNNSLKLELKEVQLALETYKAQYGRYPAPVNGGAGCYSNPPTPTQYSNDLFACPSPIIDGLVPEFISDFPHRTDSANSDCELWYTVADDGSFYKLTASNCYEGADKDGDGTKDTSTSGVQEDDEMARCLSTCGVTCDPDDADFFESFAVYSPGGQCL